MSSSVARTIRAIELACDAAVSAPQLAHALDVDVRTARTLLEALAAEQVLERRPARRTRYVPGPRLVRLAAAAADAPSAARPSIRRIA
jgi:DNA-binding IclR family transcriptional regulator